jgi:DNA/RNA-binding domain of Phe-tRNA-synthetase-like protein
MHINHAPEIWSNYPELAVGVLHATGISDQASVNELIKPYYAAARERLSNMQEGEFPEIKAWRKVFGKMGLKPTQYRCASESLLRRFRKEDTLPSLHPLVDLCNAMSLASAIPIAVFDIDKVTEFLEVRYATGAESYVDFSGAVEHPEPQEIIFADQAGNAHARRWANRQSALSAIRQDTTQVLIVIEAHHAHAAEDVRMVMRNLTEHLQTLWTAKASTATLSADTPRFEWSGSH